MVQSSLKKFYENEYRDIYTGDTDRHVLYEYEVWQGKKILKAVESQIPDLNECIVYDVGCGAGGVLEPFAEAGCRVRGCDWGRELVQYGREKNLQLEIGDVSVLAQYGQADVVILNHVLEHAADPVSFLRSLDPIIKRGGLLFIALPGIYCIPYTYESPQRFLQNAHLYHFTLETLQYVTTRAGYSIIGGDEEICALFIKDDTLSMMPFDKKEAWRVLYSWVRSGLRSRIQSWL